MEPKAETLKGQPFDLAENIAYADGAVVSKTLVSKDAGSITLFSFDKGQGISEHAAPYDAVAYIMEGRAEIVLGGKPHKVNSGQMLVMPANVPHALKAIERFKMMLIMIRSAS